MSLEHVTASSSIDPAAPATLIAPSNPSPIHTSHAHQEFPQPEPIPTSAASLEYPSSPSLAEHTERIPKLSATTTQLLARVNGNIKDTIQGSGITEYSDSGYDESNTLETSNTETRTETMKVPSTTTVTFPATHLAEPEKETSTSSLKSESIIPDTSPNFHEKVVTPKPIQPKAIPLSTAVAPPSTSNLSASSTTKQQKNATRRGNGGAKRGRKRKRGSKHDDDDDADPNGNGSSSDEATPSATQTKSGRQIHRPSHLAPKPKEEPTTKPPDVQPTRKRRRTYRKGKEINVTCNHCQRGHSPTNNVIVFCDECNVAWHQYCHDPPIGNDVIQVKEAEWFCRECRPASNDMDNSTDTVTAYPDVKPAEKIDKLVSIPFAAKVGGEQFSMAEKHAHLSKLSHTALVNLLVDISNSNPSLPIFPSNLSQSQVPSYTPPAETATSTPATSMATTLSATGNTSHISTAATSAKSANNTPPIVISGPRLNREGDSEDDEYEDVEEHRLYPKPGNGFRLPPESEDLDMLLEDPLCPTFSHSLHGSAKARAEAFGMMGMSSMA